MLVIRLARTGKKKQAYFRIVVAEKKRHVTAKFVEILGNYNPHEKNLAINKERVAFYLGNGAQPSETVAKLFKKEGIELPKWVKITEKKKAPKKEPEVKETPAPAEVPAEAPAEAEEVPAEEVTEVSAEVEQTESTETPVEETPATEEAVESTEETPVEEPVEETKEEVDNEDGGESAS